MKLKKTRYEYVVAIKNGKGHLIGPFMTVSERNDQGEKYFGVGKFGRISSSYKMPREVVNAINECKEIKDIFNSGNEKAMAEIDIMLPRDEKEE